MSEPASTAGEPSTASWTDRHRGYALRAGLRTAPGERLVLVGVPLYLRAQAVAAACATRAEIIVVRAPLAFSARQARRLIELAEARQRLLLECRPHRDARPWERGLGLDGSDETTKQTQIAATGALFAEFGRLADASAVRGYLELLDSCAPRALEPTTTRPARANEAADEAADADDAEGDANDEGEGDEGDARAWQRLAAVLDRPQVTPPPRGRFQAAAGIIAAADAVDASISSRLGVTDSRKGPERIVVVGAGMAARIHAAIGASTATVTTVVARTTVGATGLATLHGADTATSVAGIDWRHTDALIVASPPRAHAAAARAGLKAGVRVLVEKPLCATLAEARELADCAATSGGTLLYGENWSYRPWLAAAAARVRRLRPKRVEISCQWPHPGQISYEQPGYGGGVLFDSGSHALALLRMLLGQPRLLAVRARLTAGTLPSCHSHDTEAVVELRCDEGRRARLLLSWREAAPRVEARGGDFALRVSPHRELTVHGQSVTLPVTTGSPWVEGGSLALHEAFRGLRAPAASLAEGVMDLETITACYLSAGRSGRWCDLPYTGDPSLTPARTLALAIPGTTP